MMRNAALAFVILGDLVAWPVFAQDELSTRAQQLFLPIPAVPPELAGNPSTPAKVELGRMLYFDPRLSASHAQSPLVLNRRTRTRGEAIDEPTPPYLPISKPNELTVEMHCTYTGGSMLTRMATATITMGTRMIPGPGVGGVRAQA